MKARVSLYLSAVVLLTVFVVAVGCSKAPSDAQIASDIQAKLTSDSGLQGKQLVVQAANGTVTLSGTVDNDAQRDAAARYASSEEGVKQVVNNLQVAPPMQTARALAPREERKPSPAPKRRHEPRKQQDPVPDPPESVQPVAQVQAPAPAPAMPATPPPPPPPLILRGKTLEIANRLGAKSWWVSLSHTDQYAVAQVILEG